MRQVLVSDRRGLVAQRSTMGFATLEVPVVVGAVRPPEACQGRWTYNPTDLSLARPANNTLPSGNKAAVCAARCRAKLPVVRPKSPGSIRAALRSGLHLNMDITMVNSAADEVTDRSQLRVWDPSYASGCIATSPNLLRLAVLYDGFGIHSIQRREMYLGRSTRRVTLQV